MEGSLRDLAFYRLEKAKEDLERSKRELEISDYKLTLKPFILRNISCYKGSEYSG